MSLVTVQARLSRWPPAPTDIEPTGQDRFTAAYKFHGMAIRAALGQTPYAERNMLVEWGGLSAGKEQRDRLIRRRQVLPKGGGAVTAAAGAGEQKMKLTKMGCAEMAGEVREQVGEVGVLRERLGQVRARLETAFGHKQQQQQEHATKQQTINPEALLEKLEAMKQKLAKTKLALNKRLQTAHTHTHTHTPHACDHAQDQQKAELLNSPACSIERPATPSSPEIVPTRQ